MKGSWYIVKAMKETDAINSNPKTVEYDFFGDISNPADMELAREIAKNKLHTVESVSLEFKQT